MEEKLLEYGILGVILLAAGLGAWRVGVWIGRRGDRVISSHLELIEVLKEHSPKQTDHLQKISDSQKMTVVKLGEMGEQLGKGLEQQHESLKQHHEWAKEAIKAIRNGNAPP